MSKQVSKYEAVVGLDFEALKPPVRVERGELLPSSIPTSEIQEMLRDGLIKEVPTDAKRSRVQ